jgi:hypothetical protein
MRLDTTLDAEKWLRQQGSFISDVFERAATELEASGIRLLAGSAPLRLEDFDSVKMLTLLPLRFVGSDQEQSLSLSLSASIRKGVPRYLVAVSVSGTLAYESLRRLATEHPSIWQKAYLKTGLWIGEDGYSQLLTDLCQITESTSGMISITAVYLHSDRGRSIQIGVMVLGLLYRSVLDELCGASKMPRLYTQLASELDNYTPSFQRIIRP